MESRPSSLSLSAALAFAPRTCESASIFPRNGEFAASLLHRSSPSSFDVQACPASVSTTRHAPDDFVERV